MSKSELAAKIVDWLEQTPPFPHADEVRGWFTSDFTFDARGEVVGFDVLAARVRKGALATKMRLANRVESADSVALLFEAVDEAAQLATKRALFFAFDGERVRSLVEVAQKSALPARRPDPVRADELTAAALRAAEAQRERSEGELTFDDALARARALAADVLDERISATAKYWVFRVRGADSFGVVVDKRSGAATKLGATWDLETWLWGYEQGLVTGGSVDLTVTKVVDYERAVALLKKLRVSPPEGRRAALQRLPHTFAGAVDASAIQRLKNETRGVFEWKIARAESPAT
ncbi:MAG TPA: hypothetical protein VIA18_06090 [Polyangia bacterium]|nr:hypothetical protein [Polyangia bacterium]